MFETGKITQLREADSLVLRTRYEIDPDFHALVKFVGAMDAELAEIDRLLSDDKLFQLIEDALSGRYPLSTQTGRVQRQQAYQKLLSTVEASVRQAKNIQTRLKQLNGLEADKLVKSLTLFIPRVEQVINQTRRRVLSQEKVPASEKLVSLFESHTDIICRGKREPLVEFGHKVWLDEVDGGIVSNYCVLQGNPHDTQQWTQSLEQHLEIFGHPPQQASADRGVYSQTNENHAIDLEVKQVILPKSGYTSQSEYSSHSPSATEPVIIAALVFGLAM